MPLWITYLHQSIPLYFLRSFSAYRPSVDPVSSLSSWTPIAKCSSQALPVVPSAPSAPSSFSHPSIPPLIAQISLPSHLISYHIKQLHFRNLASHSLDHHRYHHSHHLVNPPLRHPQPARSTSIRGQLYTHHPRARLS